MLSRRNFALAIIMLTTAGMTVAVEQPLSVVLVQYLVSERSAERIEETVTNPLERTLKTLHRVSQIRSSTGQGTSDVEIHFEGGATDKDLASVIHQIAQLAFSDDVRVISFSIQLQPPRLQ